MTRRALGRLGLAGLLLCVASAASPAFTVRRGAALTPAPPVTPPADALRVLHLGDFGDDTRQQAAVAAAVVTAHRAAPFRLALFAGDDLYECGPDARRAGAEACTFAPDGTTVATPPTGAPDPAFARLHEAPLAGLAHGTAPPRVLLALGNHDVATRGTCFSFALDGEVAARRKACLEVAHVSPLWSMPGRHYVVDEGPARFIVIDSNLLLGDYGGFTLEQEVAFVREAVAGCGARACFLVGHHPPATAGVHVGDFDGPDRLARQGRLLAAAGGAVRAFLAGHDHDLQHLRTGAGLDVLVSGNGARERPDERFERVAPDGESLFASVSPGFAVLSVWRGGYAWRAVDVGGTSLYCCAAGATGPCLPSTCP